MKGRRDPIVSRKLKLVSDLINTFENLKRANIPRAELPAGQPQLDVPCGEPDPLSWLVGSRAVQLIEIQFQFRFQPPTIMKIQ